MDYSNKLLHAFFGLVHGDDTIVVFVSYLVDPLVVIVGSRHSSLDRIHPCMVVSLRICLQNVAPTTSDDTYDTYS